MSTPLCRPCFRQRDVVRRTCPHEELLAGRGEDRVTLLVNPKAGDGKVQAVYERWAYEKIGEQQPFPDSPVFAAMMRDPLHQV
jgi:hypothetical protein